MTCHAPHGSIVEKLLVEDNNGLCQQCHFDARFPLIGAVDHTGFLSAGARCWDCHFQVHGSNTDENFVPLRIEELRRGGGRR
jgi:predicted CXXCH cytochrome family protein